MRKKNSFIDKFLIHWYIFFFAKLNGVSVSAMAEINPIKIADINAYNANRRRWLKKKFDIKCNKTM